MISTAETVGVSIHYMQQGLFPTGNLSEVVLPAVETCRFIIKEPLKNSYFREKFKQPEWLRLNAGA